MEREAKTRNVSDRVKKKAKKICHFFDWSFADVKGWPIVLAGTRAFHAGENCFDEEKIHSLARLFVRVRDTEPPEVVPLKSEWNGSIGKHLSSTRTTRRSAGSTGDERPPRVFRWSSSPPISPYSHFCATGSFRCAPLVIFYLTLERVGRLLSRLLSSLSLSLSLYVRG